MTSTFDYLALTNLGEFSMVAGSDQELTFNLYTSACALVNLAGATSELRLYRYGNPSITMVLKAGSISASPLGRINFRLDALDTAGSSGKFMEILSITDATGSVIRCGQGIVNIIPYPS
jgi:hypothetical protein